MSRYPEYSSVNSDQSYYNGIEKTDIIEDSGKKYSEGSLIALAEPIAYLNTETYTFGSHLSEGVLRKLEGNSFDYSNFEFSYKKKRKIPMSNVKIKNSTISSLDATKFLYGSQKNTFDFSKTVAGDFFDIYCDSFWNLLCFDCNYDFPFELEFYLKSNKFSTTAYYFYMRRDNKHYFLIPLEKKDVVRVKITSINATPSGVKNMELYDLSGSAFSNIADVNYDMLFGAGGDSVRFAESGVKKSIIIDLGNPSYYINIKVEKYSFFPDNPPCSYYFYYADGYENTGGNMFEEKVKFFQRPTRYIVLDYGDYNNANVAISKITVYNFANCFGANGIRIDPDDIHYFLTGSDNSVGRIQFDQYSSEFCVEFKEEKNIAMIKLKFHNLGGALSGNQISLDYFDSQSQLFERPERPRIITIDKDKGNIHSFLVLFPKKTKKVLFTFLGFASCSLSSIEFYDSDVSVWYERRFLLNYGSDVGYYCFRKEKEIPTSEYLFVGGDAQPYPGSTLPLLLGATFDGKIMVEMLVDDAYRVQPTGIYHVKKGAWHIGFFNKLDHSYIYDFNFFRGIRFQLEHVPVGENVYFQFVYPKQIIFEKKLLMANIMNGNSLFYSVGDKYFDCNSPFAPGGVNGPPGNEIPPGKMYWKQGMREKKAKISFLIARRSEVGRFDWRKIPFGNSEPPAIDNMSYPFDMFIGFYERFLPSQEPIFLNYVFYPLQNVVYKKSFLTNNFIHRTEDDVVYNGSPAYNSYYFYQYVEAEVDLSDMQFRNDEIFFYIGLSDQTMALAGYAIEIL
ncbi:MAG: hypothetical protein N3A54_00970 [Patescibacteria group bacterium]|nr:hypothetical protein [Patescibacteria group bacterium]